MADSVEQGGAHAVVFGQGKRGGRGFGETSLLVGDGHLGGERREHPLVLNGASELLNMDMSKASKEFDVRKPNTKRDQKSGVKKRKQYDIELGRLAEIEAAGE